MTTAMSDQLVMVIDSTPHYGWKEASISRSIERGPHQFSLQLSENWNTDNKVNRRSIEKGMELLAYVNDDLLLTGYVNDLQPSYDKQSHSIRINGGNRLVDLVDCSTTGKQFVKQSLLQICTTLCKPFGIQVRVDASVVNAANKMFVNTHRLDLGEPIWEFLEELARIRAVLLTSNANGDLVITRAGTASADVALVLGQNIKTARGNFSDRNLFSEYTVSGQQGNEPFTQLEGVDTALPMATVKGSGRYRPFAVAADNPMDQAGCMTRAEWQKNVNEGRADSVTYTVSGWRQQEGGRIWAPNELVTVTDPYQGFSKRELLIAEHRLILNDQGSNTELRVMPKGAFDLVPQVEQAAEGYQL
ncbi:MAG: phage baseplate assembly protein [Neptuniibacter sp.]